MGGEPYESWDHDALIAEIRALVDTVERLEAEKQAAEDEMHRLAPIVTRKEWLYRCFREANADRRYAWGELKHEEARALEAERRLADSVSGKFLVERDQWKLVAETMEATRDAMRKERDRLQAIVDHLRETAEEAIGQDRDDQYDEGNRDAWIYARNVIDGKAKP